MPNDTNLPAQGAPVAAPAAEVVKLPATPAERLKTRLESAVKETHEQRSERRAAEHKRHLDAHMETIAGIHAAYPAPFFTKGMPEVAGLSDAAMADVMTAWNTRRHQIDMANKAYYNAVRATYAEHVVEDAHIRRTIDAKNAA